MQGQKKKRCLIIAEVGSVHDGSFGNAKKLIELAADCGADAVKFQTHIAEAETLINAPEPPFFKGEPRFDYFKRISFTPSQWKELKKHSQRNKIIFLSSPFSIEAAKLLSDIGMKIFKIPSGETTNLPLLEFIAKQRKPILLSSGMNSWEELDAAVELTKKYNKDVTVLQCTSEYPCAYERVGLNILLEMKERYDLPIGISDHTLTNYASFAAVVLGATVVEKHLTFSRRMYGSDASHSLEPEEFKDLVRGIRAIDFMLNTKVNKNDLSRFRGMKRVFEKSIVSKVDITKHTKITPEMLTLKKPGTGLSSKNLIRIIGKRARHKIKASKIIKKSDLY